MAEFNAVNRGVYISDNLYFLRSLNDECLDLVNIDPPFAKNDTFGKKTPNAKDPLKPPLRQVERDNELRLLEIWGIKNQAEAVQAEIVWPETAYRDIWDWETDVHEEWVNLIDDDFPAISSVIDSTRHTHSDSTAAYLCYMAIRLIEIHRIIKPTGSLFLHCDHTASGYLRQLLDAIFGNGENNKAGFRNEIVWEYGLGGSSKRTFSRKHDTIFWYSKSAQWYFKKPTVQATSQMLQGQRKGMKDVWPDIPSLNNMSKERTGYPTQKPVALAERIITAATKPGDVVLDCFAGCAYSAIASERLGRRWIACDINPRAWTVLKRQFNKPKLALLTCTDAAAPGQQVTPDNPIVTIHGPNQLPIRTSPENETAPPVFRLPERKFKVAASIIPEPEMLTELLKLSDYKAWCCGFANRRPDGRIIQTTRNFHLDHIAPKSKENTGTSNDIQNRAPMCPYHNIRKNNRRVPLAEYRQEIADAGELMVDTTNDLINLDYAFQEANKLFGIAWAKKYPIGV